MARESWLSRRSDDDNVSPVIVETAFFTFSVKHMMVCVIIDQTFAAIPLPNEVDHNKFLSKDLKDYEHVFVLLAQK